MKLIEFFFLSIISFFVGFFFFRFFNIFLEKKSPFVFFFVLFCFFFSSFCFI